MELSWARTERFGASVPLGSTRALTCRTACAVSSSLSARSGALLPSLCRCTAWANAVKSVESLTPILRPRLNCTGGHTWVAWIHRKPGRFRASLSQGSLKSLENNGKRLGGRRGRAKSIRKGHAAEPQDRH